jgi:trehalose 6-phosphate phosphatase
VLAPIVDDPATARALPGTMDDVARLAAADGVTVALVSGRSRADLVRVTGIQDGGPVLAIGSHGAEWDGASLAGDLLDEAAAQRLAAVRELLGKVAARYDGARVEDKPAAAVLHTRRMPDRAAAAAATRSVLEVLQSVPGLHVTPGKEVVEVSVVTATKGAAVARLRDRLGPGCTVLFIGDDVTDETVFGTLGEGDVGVKVGPGSTAAHHRVTDPEAVRMLVRELVAGLSR